MKRINKLNISFFKTGVVVLLLNFSSCDEKELLNPIPETAIQGANTFDNPQRVLAQVNSIYTALKAGNFYGGRYVMLCDIRGEEFLNRTQNVFTGYDAWSHTVNSGSNDSFTTWGSAYATINAANLFLDGLEKNIAKVDANLAKEYTGEAKFLRALSYFSLVTLYAQPYNKDNGASIGIPLRLKGESTLANNDLKRSTVAEVYTQILKDLNEAEPDVRLAHANALLNTTRAHKNSVIALKTRVYLNMGNFAKVIEEAKKIVPDNAPYIASTGVANSLNSSIIEIFSTNYTTNESMFSMPMTELNSVTGQSSLGFEYNVNTEYSLNAGGVIGDTEWKTTDARRSGFVRISNANSFLRKYAKTSPFLDYVPVVRYAEVLLNYAEAAAKTGDLTKATALLTAVRKRSDASYVFPATAISTGTALVNTILKERRIELIGEGFRSNDILRNLLPIPAKGSGSLSSPAVLPSAPEYIFPIPNAEISANKLL